MAQSRTVLVTTVKNEGPNILEWVAHHRLCGFDNIVVCQNDSTDLTQRTLKVLDQLGIITYIHNRNIPGSIQMAAYRKARKTRAYRDADYCLALDGDEYFRCDLPSGTVGELLKSTSFPDCLHLNWQNFGSNGHKTLSEEQVLSRYLTCSETDRVKNYLEGIKTLFRTDAFERIGIHRPRFPKRLNIRAVNGSGLEANAYRHHRWRCTDPMQMKLARIHHYPVRDAASFVLKCTRGSAHQDFRDVGRRYWRRFDHNTETDTTLADRSRMVLEEMKRLDDLSGGRLMLLRRKSLRIWRQTYREAMEDPRLADFYKELVSTPEATAAE